MIGLELGAVRSARGHGVTRDLGMDDGRWARWLWSPGMKVDAYDEEGTRLNDSACDGTEAIVVTGIEHYPPTLSVEGVVTDLIAIDAATERGAVVIYLHGSHPGLTNFEAPGDVRGELTSRAERARRELSWLMRVLRELDRAEADR